LGITPLGTVLIDQPHGGEAHQRANRQACLVSKPIKLLPMLRRQSNF
jgi:hypothetical protein